MARTPQGMGSISVDPGKPPKPRKPGRTSTYSGTSAGQGTGSITVDPNKNPPRVRNTPPPPNPVTGAGPGPNLPPTNRLLGLDPGLQGALKAPPPRPFDPTEETQLGINSRNETQTEAYLDEQRDQTIRDYGLDDPTDPFSRARALQLSYQNRDRGNLNSYAARGQLYAGSYQNAVNDSSTAYLGGYDSLRKGQNDVLAQIERKRMLARSGKEQADQDAHSAALDRAVATKVDDTTTSAKDKKPTKPGTPSTPPKGASPGGVVTQRGHRGRQTFAGGQGFGQITVTPGRPKKGKRGRKGSGSRTVSGSFGGAQGSGTTK